MYAYLYVYSGLHGVPYTHLRMRSMHWSLYDQALYRPLRQARLRVRGKRQCKRYQREHRHEGSGLRLHAGLRQELRHGVHRQAQRPRPAQLRHQQVLMTCA